MSINRNIVECKVKNFLADYDSGKVLIETLWNVKLKVTLSLLTEIAY